MNQIAHPDKRSEDCVALAEWLIEQGLVGATQDELFQGYCQRLADMGVPVMRVHVAQSAFHPRYGGFGFEWLSEGSMETRRYAHSETPIEAWVRSPLYHLLRSQQKELRIRLNCTHGPQFPMLLDLQERGGTDYFAVGLVMTRQDNSAPIDPNNAPEGVMISWTSDAPQGFSDADLMAVKSVLPQLGLALKSASNRKVAQELLGVYLGSDAGERVLSGEIQRGSLQEIHAVICYFDLAGFTSLAERTPGHDMIAILNEYFALVVEVIEAQGGHVLKFMGDGILAMFDVGGSQADADAGLRAAAELSRVIRAANLARLRSTLPAMGFTLALHAGEILYGNIGAPNRLDFTAIGPAVNLAARLSDMHRALGQDIIISEQVFQAASKDQHDLVSLGRYMLRGVSEPQELYTVLDAKA